MAYFDFEPEEQFPSTWAPVVDVYESAAEIIIRAELPGVRRQDIRLHWKDGVLRVSGTKDRRLEQGVRGRFLCVERQYGIFRRDISINMPIDLENSSAQFRNGLLKVRLPKAAGHGRELSIPIDES